MVYIYKNKQQFVLPPKLIRGIISYIPTNNYFHSKHLHYGLTLQTPLYLLCLIFRLMSGKNSRAVAFCGSYFRTEIHEVQFKNIAKPSVYWSLFVIYCGCGVRSITFRYVYCGKCQYFRVILRDNITMDCLWKIQTQLLFEYYLTWGIEEQKYGKSLLTGLA